MKTFFLGDHPKSLAKTTRRPFLFFCRSPKKPRRPFFFRDHLKNFTKTTRHLKIVIIFASKLSLPVFDVRQSFFLIQRLDSLLYLAKHLKFLSLLVGCFTVNYFLLTIRLTAHFDRCYFTGPSIIFWGF